MSQNFYSLMPPLYYKKHKYQIKLEIVERDIVNLIRSNNKINDKISLFTDLIKVDVRPIDTKKFHNMSVVLITI